MPKLSLTADPIPKMAAPFRSVVTFHMREVAGSNPASPTIDVEVLAALFVR